MTAPGPEPQVSRLPLFKGAQAFESPALLFYCLFFLSSSSFTTPAKVSLSRG